MITPWIKEWRQKGQTETKDDEVSKLKKVLERGYDGDDTLVGLVELIFLAARRMKRDKGWAFLR